MNDREFDKLIAQSSLGTPRARRLIRQGDQMIGIKGEQRRIDEVHRQTPPCEVGDRVRLTAPMRNPDSELIPVEAVPVGTEGSVKWINTACGVDIGYQIYVEWDNGSTLDLLPGDGFEVIL
jgi:hypothetical protein